MKFIPVTAIVAIVAVLALTWVMLVLTARFGGSGSGGGIMRDLVIRYMVLIVIAKGIQFALTGHKSFMGVVDGLRISRILKCPRGKKRDTVTSYEKRGLRLRLLQHRIRQIFSR